MQGECQPHPQRLRPWLLVIYFQLSHPKNLLIKHFNLTLVTHNSAAASYGPFSLFNAVFPATIPAT